MAQLLAQDGDPAVSRTLNRKCDRHESAHAKFVVWTKHSMLTLCGHCAYQYRAALQDFIVEPLDDDTTPVRKIEWASL